MVTIEKAVWMNSLEYKDWQYQFSTLGQLERWWLEAMYELEEDNKAILAEVIQWPLYDTRYYWDNRKSTENLYWNRHKRPRRLPGYFKWRSDLGKVSGAFNWYLSIGGCTPDPLKCLTHVIENERQSNGKILLEIKGW